MAINNQSTTLSRGGAAPSVQYNAAVRMPTQPMPELPDVNSSFNIDLRPIGEALIAGKELEFKKEQAELDRIEKRLLMQEQFAHDYEMKTMEIESLEARAKAANDIAWYNAYTDRLKAEKDKEQDGYKALKRAGTQFLLNKGRELTADIEAGMTPNAVKIKEKQIVDEFTTTFAGLPITDVVEDTRKLYPTFLQNISTASVAQHEAVKKGYEKKNEQDAEGVQRLMDSFNLDPESAVYMNKNLENNLHMAKTSLAVLNDPNAPAESKDKAQKDFNEAVKNTAGLAALAQYGDTAVKGNLDVTTVHDGFINNARKLGADYNTAEYLYNLWDRSIGYSKSVDFVSKLDKDFVARNETAIKKIIGSGHLRLLQSDAFIRNFSVLNAVDSRLGKIILDSGVADPFVENIAQGSIPHVVRDGTGYATIKVGGQSYVLNPDQIKQIEARGISLEEDVNQIYNKTTLEALNGGEVVQGTTMAYPYITPKSDDDKEIISAANNLQNIANNTNSLSNVIKACENSDKRICKVFSGKYKTLNALGEEKYWELERQIKQFIPNQFGSDYIKGGVIEIIPNEDGTIELWRDSYGLAGGTGYKQALINNYLIETTLNKLPKDITVEEKIALLEADLTDATGAPRFIRRPTGYKVPLTKQAVELAQRLVAEPVDLAAIGDTEITNFSTWASKKFNINMTEPARESSANAKMVENASGTGDVESSWIDVNTGEKADIKTSSELEKISDNVTVAYDGDAEGVSVYTIYDNALGRAYKVQLPDTQEVDYKEIYRMFKDNEIKSLREFKYVR